MSTEIPFNISGRTARLIGRENVSNLYGALIELIKNNMIIFKDLIDLYSKHYFELTYLKKDSVLSYEK